MRSGLSFGHLKPLGSWNSFQVVAGRYMRPNKNMSQNFCNYFRPTHLASLLFILIGVTITSKCHRWSFLDTLPEGWGGRQILSPDGLNTFLDHVYETWQWWRNLYLYPNRCLCYMSCPSNPLIWSPSCLVTGLTWSCSLDLEHFLELFFFLSSQNVPSIRLSRPRELACNSCPWHVGL